MLEYLGSSTRGRHPAFAIWQGNEAELPGKGDATKTIRSCHLVLAVDHRQSSLN